MKELPYLEEIYDLHYLEEARIILQLYTSGNNLKVSEQVNSSIWDILNPNCAKVLLVILKGSFFLTNFDYFHSYRNSPLKIGNDAG